MKRNHGRLIAVVCLALICGLSSAAHAGKKAHGTVFITQKDNQARAKSADSGKVLFKNPRPLCVIEWALDQARITVLRKGTYKVMRTVTIPESNTALIIGPEAELTADPEAKLRVLTEGHGNYAALIHNQRRDNVSIINLGTLDGGGEPVERGGGARDYRFSGEGYAKASANGVIFDGRNGGTCGINGGLVFSIGATPRVHEPFWIVDSADVRIPLIWGETYGNCPLVMEGCEDCKVGMVAGIAGGKASENETLDFNSFNERITVDTLLGVGPVKDEILDINNSPECTINRVVGYGNPDRIELVSRGIYGPGGRRLTQKPYIDHSNGTVVHKQEVKDVQVAEWRKEVELHDFPGSLPVLKIDATLTGVLEDGSEQEVFSKSYRLDLKKQQ